MNTQYTAPVPSERREHILRVARELWGAHGYHSMSLRHIARQADVALALIDHHFGAKHVLFAEAVQPLAQACDRSRHRLQQAAAQEPHTARDALTLLMQPATELGVTTQGVDLMLLWLRHRHDPLPEVRQPLERATLPLKTAVAGVLARTWPAAERPATLVATCFAFGSSFELAASRQRPGAIHPTDGVAESALGLNVVLELFLSGLHTAWGSGPAPNGLSPAA